MQQDSKREQLAQERQQAVRRLVGRLLEMAESGDEDGMETVIVPGGDVLFHQGDEANSLYILRAGVLGIRMRGANGQETEIARLAPGAVVGEMALLEGMARTATVIAVNDAGLLRVSKERFLQLVDEDVSARRALQAVAEPRWKQDQLYRVLGALLDGVDASTLASVADYVNWFSYVNGDVVFRQGDAPDGLYLLINGRLRVTYEEKDGSQRFLGEIHAGEMVGEMGVLADEPRSATVHAVRASNLVRISPSGFRQLTRQHPELMAKIAGTIVERRRKALQGGERPTLCAMTIAIIPASERVDALQFAQELGHALEQLDSCLILDAAVFDERFGSAGAAQASAADPRHAAMVAWINELEFQVSTILYVADPEPTVWTRRCIGQADRALVVAYPGDDPAPGAAEQLLAEMDIPVRSDLVLWHPVNTEWPRGTAVWLDARQVQSHYHVRKGDGAHMERLARRLRGRAVALVCSGGAARAYAEMGVFRAMQELGIPVDFVSGTSMGAIIAGGIALGFDYAQMEEAAQWTDNYGVADYTLPLASLMTSEHVTRICRQLFGDHLIEDLWLPYFCVSTNLSTAEPVYHRRGPMWRAIRASMAIPGVYLPVTENEEVLVDGGAMDNFPVRKTIELSETQHVIGVHVSPYKERKRQYDYDTSLSGWRVLWSRLNPFRKPLRTPSFLDIMMRSVEVNGVRHGRADEEAVELLIHPDMRGISPTDYSAFRKLAQIGYDAALEPLQEWQAAYR